MVNIEEVMNKVSYVYSSDVAQKIYDQEANVTECDHALIAFGLCVKLGLPNWLAIGMFFHDMGRVWPRNNQTYYSGGEEERKRAIVADIPEDHMDHDDRGADIIEKQLLFGGKIPKISKNHTQIKIYLMDVWKEIYNNDIITKESQTSAIKQMQKFAQNGYDSYVWRERKKKIEQDPDVKIWIVARMIDEMSKVKNMNLDLGETLVIMRPLIEKELYSENKDHHVLELSHIENIMALFYLMVEDYKKYENLLLEDKVEEFIRDYDEKNRLFNKHKDEHVHKLCLNNSVLSLC